MLIIQDFQITLPLLSFTPNFQKKNFLFTSFYLNQSQMRSLLSLSVEICSYIICLILIILMIYCNARLCSCNHEMFIEKRSKPLLYGLNASYMLLIIGSVFGQIAMLHNFSYKARFLPAAVYLTALWSLYFFLITMTSTVDLFKYTGSFFPPLSDS